MLKSVKEIRRHKVKEVAVEKRNLLNLLACILDIIVFNYEMILSIVKIIFTKLLHYNL